MKQVTIRETRLRDMPAVTCIYRHAVIHGTASFELDPPDETEMTNRFRTMEEQNYPHLIAEAGAGTIAGFAYANAFRARPAYRWSVENSVYIDPDFQGDGLGHLLLQNLIERSEKLGFRQMIAVIGGSSHKASIKLHENLGFEMIGAFRGSGYKHGQWLDTVFMQRTLGEGQASQPDVGTYPGTLYPPIGG